MEIEKLTPQLIQEMDEALWGKKVKPRAIFTTGRKLDVVASQEAGRRIEHLIPYLTLKFPGSTDAVSQPATQAQMQKYAAEFAQYQEDIRRGNQERYQGWQDLGGSHSGQQHGEVDRQGAGVRAVDEIRAIGRAIG